MGPTLTRLARHPQSGRLSLLHRGDQCGRVDRQRPRDAHDIHEAHVAKAPLDVAAMDAYGVRRLVALSGAAVDVPGDRKPLVDRLASSVVRRLARHVVAAKQREYLALASSSLDWTALRPPLVGDGGTKGYRLDLRLQPGARVTRADVAQALVDQLTDRQFLGAAPFVLPAHRH